LRAAVVELVAATWPERAAGLVLVNPVPLAGTRLPDEVIDRFRSLGRDPEAQRAVRTQLSPAWPEAGLDRLVVSGARIRPEVVRDFAGCWNTGHLATSTTSWPVCSPPVAGPRRGPFLRRVGRTLSQQSHQTHSVRLSLPTDMVLDARALTHPAEGRDQVKKVMGTTSTVYESDAFTQEAVNGPRTYREWEATAFGGMCLEGVTVLTKDEKGQIVRAAIRHRPLDAVKRFSSELRKRLRGVFDAEHFHQG
jgi:hypothetical protein